MKVFSGIKALFGKNPKPTEPRGTDNPNLQSQHMMTTEVPILSPHRYRMPSIENCHIPSAFQAESGEKLGSSNLAIEENIYEEMAVIPSVPTLVRIPSTRGEHLLGTNISPNPIKASPGSNSSPLRRRRTALTQLSHPYLFAIHSPHMDADHRPQLPSSPFIEEPVSAYLKSRKLSSLYPPQTPRPQLEAPTPRTPRQSSPSLHR